MKHGIDTYIDWCQWFGRSRLEIEETLSACDGTPGKIHPRFFEAQEKARRMFDPIVDTVVEQCFPNLCKPSAPTSKPN